MPAGVQPLVNGSRLCEISDPLSWASCFLAFMAARVDHQETRELAAYGSIVLQLARKHAGGGWLAYDRQYRQHQAAGANLSWTDISPSLMAATVRWQKVGVAHALCVWPLTTRERTVPLHLWNSQSPNQLFPVSQHHLINTAVLPLMVTTTCAIGSTEVGVTATRADFSTRARIVLSRTIRNTAAQMPVGSKRVAVHLLRILQVHSTQAYQEGNPASIDLTSNS